MRQRYLGDSVRVISPIEALTDNTHKFYNISGTLYFNGVEVGTDNNSWVNSNDYTTYTTLVSAINSVQDNVVSADNNVWVNANDYATFVTVTSLIDTVQDNINSLPDSAANDYNTLTSVRDEYRANDYSTYTTLSTLINTVNANVDALPDSAANDYNTYTTVSSLIKDATITISAGGGLTTGGSFTLNQSTNETVTINHADTSSQSSINNSSGSVIQDITLDTYGHVTAIGSTNLDDRYFTETESDARFLGISATATDSALLDGIDSTQFIRSDVSDIKTSGALTFNDNIQLNIGSGNDVEHYWNGSNYYTDINSGGIWYIRDGNSSNTTRYTFDVDNGTFTATGDITAYSDERLKSNIKTYKDALKKIELLRGVSYEKDGKKGIGVIAQEVEKVVPEVINDSGEYKAVAYGNLVGILIEAVKELSQEVNRLKEERK